VIAWHKVVVRAKHCVARLLSDERAAQLVEFAVALPLLVVFVVGIFDFSGAFTLKQKLTNIARDAARAGAMDPPNDLRSPSSAVPVSVMDAFQIVDNYLIAGNLNDCGISSSSGIGVGLTWRFAASGNGCPPGGLTIIINRGYYYPATGAAVPDVNCNPQSPAGGLAVVSTCVSIQYGYAWRFGQAASLLGRATTLPNPVSGIAVALNEN
jgi:TadE-like protein